jgi:uncharacterized protein
MKSIFDPIHSFIELTPEESKFIKLTPFRRLQSIHQMGGAYFVYPGGGHKRYEHSLGVMYVASKIFDHVIAITDHPDVPKAGSPEAAYYKRVLRFACLCHDLGHLPFSHTAEHLILGDKGHEKFTRKILESSSVSEFFKGIGLKVSDIVKTSIGSAYEGEFTAFERILSEMLTGDFFGADRIDYLLRDSYFTGLAYGSFDYRHLIQCLRILSNDGAISLGVDENGLESCYALLLARYFMHKRLYQYPSVKAYSFHLARFIEKFYEGKDYLKSVENYLKVGDYEILSRLNSAYLDPDDALHNEASCLLDADKKFEALLINKGDYQQLVQSIDDKGAFVYEENTSFNSCSGLSFLVLRRDGSIVDAADIAEVSIPYVVKHWIYVPPEYRDKVSHSLHVKRDSIKKSL